MANKRLIKADTDKMKEIKITFYAYVNEEDFDEVKQAFGKSGAEIIGEEFPELKDIGYFKVEEI